MPNTTHSFPVGEFVEFNSKNGMIARFKIVSHLEYSENYKVRSRSDSQDWTFSFTEEDLVERARLYAEPDPW
jgi:hypothetical protein